MPRRSSLLWVAVAAVALGLPDRAAAESVAYVDDGEVWVASLDGSQKARVAAPVVNAEGETEKWLDVAQSDGGRIVAVRNVPGRISRFSSFQVWEPDGTSAVQGPLNAPSGWSIYVYPLGFDITADGSHLVYGFTNSSACCPSTISSGIYVRPATSSVLDPIQISGWEHPSLVGDRIVAASGNTIAVQDDDGASPYGSDFTPWLDTSGTALDQRGVDVAANGTLAAYEVEQWTEGQQTTGKVGVVSIAGIDQPVTFPAAVDCYLPAEGVAKEVSLSPDAARIAWTDARGLNVAGSPATAADPCVLSAPAVVVSATGDHGSIGGADVASFLPAAPTPPGDPQAPPPAPGMAGTPGTPATPGTSRPPVAPVFRLPARVRARALASPRGLGLTLRLGAGGPVAVTARVPAARLGRRGKPVLVASGKATAAAAGDIRVTLRVKRAWRRKVGRLRGTRLTLRAVHAGQVATRVVRLR